jgi:hypothetical protein
LAQREKRGEVIVEGDDHEFVGGGVRKDLLIGMEERVMS